MAAFGALLLIFILLIRPQEFIPQLQAFSLLNVVTAFSVLGILIEFGMRKQRSAWSPQLPFLLAFVAWGFFCTMKNLGVRDGYSSTYTALGLSTIFMLVITYAARSYERYRAIAVMLVFIGTALSLICIHQAQQEPQCIALARGTGGQEADRSEGEPDGRSCDTAYICEREGKEHTDYDCEKVGLFGTFTQGMRVRWRGTLGDPNELAILIAAVLPFLFAFNTLVKRAWFTVVMMGLLALSLYCVVLSGSRGGQLVTLTVFGVYFVRRYGLKGLVIGAVLALPVLLLGGRGGEEAESSSEERIQLLYEGMDMIKAYPVFGVGVGQFVEHSFNYLTAHNSYVLAAAESGLPGSILWVSLVYISVKIPYAIASNPPPGTDPRLVPFAFALVVSFAGILVGIFFLSFCYKALLFIYFGLSGALYGAVKRTCPDFDVRVGRKELIWLVGADAAVLAFVFVYSRIKGVA